MADRSGSHQHDHGGHDHHDHDRNQGTGGKGDGVRKPRAGDSFDPAASYMVCCGHHEANSEKSIVYALVGGAMVLTTVVANWLGQEELVAQIPAVIGSVLLWIPLARGAYKEVRRGRPSSSSLATVAIAAAFASTQYVTAGALAFILFIMDAVVRRTAWGAHKAIEELVRLTPTVARVVENGVEREVSLGEVRIGSMIRVRPGENLPADGVVASGRSTINQSSLTGESAPVEVQKGEAVYAGTTNLTGGIDVEVTRVGADTTIGKVVSLINAAEEARTPRQQIIEQVASHYVWVVLMVTAAVWFLTPKSAEVTGTLSAMERAISVLVVTCPGALLLASPTAMVAAFAAAARLGVMIKSTENLEAAATVDTVVLDKTGTLTTGKFAVSRLAPAEGVDGARLLEAAATAERHSNHPLAKAIMETARAARIDPSAAVDEAEEVHGLGVRIKAGARTLHVGRAKWLRQVNPSIDASVKAVEDRIEGMTGVHVIDNGKYLGAVGLEDRLRPRAAEVVATLRDLGVRRIAMFTGDREAVAKRVAEAVRIDQVAAECHPEEKHALIVQMTQRGQRVMMVGDGVNDGPSLAAADVGVAMGLSGTDIAANSAGIALMNDDLMRIPFLIQLGRKTRGVIAQNIAAAILIALVGLALAASGALGSHALLIAAAYHFLGDIFVIANSFRLVRFGEGFEEQGLAAESGGGPTLGRGVGAPAAAVPA